MRVSKTAIGLIHYSAPPVVGGVENVIGHHAELMHEAGHRVRIIAGRGSRHQRHAEADLIPLVDSKHPEVLAIKAILDKGIVPQAFGELVESIEEELTEAMRGLDIVVAHNVCSLHKNLALAAAIRNTCRLPGAPRLIIWHHDLAWSSRLYQAELHNGWPWSLIREDWPEVRPLHVVVSELRGRELAQLFEISRDRIHVVPSGLDGERFYKLEAQTSELIGRCQYQEADPRLLLPVRVTRRKNIELAIRVIAAMRLTRPHATLIVTGPPGPHNPSNQTYLGELQHLRAELGLDEQVLFLTEMVTEYLPDVVIADLYRVSDALLLPSRDEGFGLPILEAGLAGLPIFCADIPALREIADSFATYFSPDDDPLDLAQTILKVLEDDNTYQLKRRIRQSYSWHSVFAERIAPLLEL